MGSADSPITPDRWREVSRIYAAVAAREPHLRAATLETACRGDADLLREVQSLLREAGDSLVIDRPLAETANAILQIDLIGRQLGPYRIDTAIGAGGMGHVYRATDTRLHRTVAIKILPPALAENPQFRARFEREAKAIAALNHPHICMLYDVGRVDGIDYLVMEYVEGETLAARLERGALPFAQALTTSIEIADALAAAHQIGIVHRDLKPANVMVTKVGAKLLDFGLAKTSASTVAGPMTMAPTTPTGAVRIGPLTTQGTLLGTFQYMAPEQLEGKEADARTDVFAFGTLAYETITGKKAFEGKSQASLIGAIMHTDPAPMIARQPLAPPAFERLIQKCLAKDPERRWQSTQDLTSELLWIAETKSEVKATRADARRWRPLAWIGATLLLLAGVAGILFWFNSRPQAGLITAVARFSIAPPESARWSGNRGGGKSLAVSPDGRWIVFGVVQNQTNSLWLRSLDSLTSRELPGTEYGSLPFWSPDSRSIGFFTQNEVKRVDVAGGAAQKIADLNAGTGGAWGPDGTILLSGSGRDEVSFLRTTERGDRPAPVILSVKGARLPSFLPDGQRFLFLTTPPGSGQGGTIYLGRLGSSEATHLMDDAWGVAYASGQILFVRGDTLFAQPFDVDSARLTGRAVPLADPVGISQTGAASFSVSTNGFLVHAGTGRIQRQLMWVNRSGQVMERITTGPLPVEVVSLSADDRQLLTARPDPITSAQTLWLMTRDQQGPSRIGEGTGNSVLSPDGRWVVAATPPPVRIRRIGLADGRIDWLVENKIAFPTDWSSDGRLILIQHAEPGTQFDISVLDPDTKAIRSILHTRANEGQARFSPDMRWISYVSNESGQPEVYLHPFGAEGMAIPISKGGGTQPRWRRDGKELYFLSADNQVMAVEIGTRTGTPSASPKPLFPLRTLQRPSGMFGVDYLPAANGNRFLVAPIANGQRTDDLTVVVNWATALPK